MIDPLVGGALIGGAANLIGGAVNNIVNRSNMRAQTEQAKELMDYQWNKYQSYGAQVREMQAAGLNPAAMYGQSGTSSASPSVNMPTIAPSGYDFSNIANSALAIAQAKKAGSEQVAQELENDVLRKTQEERIKQAALQNKYTEEETNKIIMEWQKLVGEANILQKDAELKQIDLDTRPHLVNAILREYQDKHNLSDQQFNALKVQLPEVLKKLQNENKLLDVDVDIAQSFKQTMATTGLVGDCLKILTQLLKIFK